MKYIIDENQLLKLKLFLEQRPDPMMPFQPEKYGYDPNKPKTLKPSLEKQHAAIQDWVIFCKSNKELCYSVGEIGLWFVPFIGPYLSASLGMVQGMDYIKHGNKTLGIIYILLSPLMLSKAIRILGVIEPNAEILPILNKINKTGLPIFLTQGEQAFFSWVEKNFGKKIKDGLIRLINSKEMAKEYKNVFNSKIKPQIEKWISDNPNAYNKLKPADQDKLKMIIKSSV
jgi:hypothetical protein